MGMIIQTQRWITEEWLKNRLWQLLPINLYVSIYFESNPNIVMDSAEISNTNRDKNLGLHIDRRLIWKNHV